MNDVKFSINSYTMNQNSLYIGGEAVKDDVYFKETVSKIINTREKTMLKLKEMGFEGTDSKTNFLFVKHNTMSASEIFEKLKEKDIFVRYFKTPGIDNYLRITIGTDEEMEMLIKRKSFIFPYTKPYTKKRQKWITRLTIIPISTTTLFLQ